MMCLGSVWGRFRLEFRVTGMGFGVGLGFASKKFRTVWGGFREALRWV